MSAQIKVIHRKQGFFDDEKFSEFEKRANDFAKEHNARDIIFCRTNFYNSSFFVIHNNSHPNNKDSYSILTKYVP